MAEEMNDKQDKKRHPLRNAICAVVFTALVGATFVWATLAFSMQGRAQNTGAFAAFYDTPEDSVDVAYIGTSAASRFFVNPQAFEEEGVSTFPFGIQNTPLFLYDNLMDEFQTKQNPEVFVIELRPLLKDGEMLAEENCRRPIDSVSLLSPNRMGMFEESLQVMSAQLEPGSYDDNKWDYVFPVIKYHGRATDGTMTVDDLLLNKPYNTMQGFACGSVTLSQVALGESKFTDRVGKLTDVQEEHLQDLLDYCETLDAHVLFVLAPQVCETYDKSKSLNAIQKFVEDQGWDCLNFNSDEMFAKLGLDHTTDFYNKNHCNYLGAEKYTSYLTSYLKDTYNLTDHRGDDTYQQWVDGYEDYQDFVSKGIKKSSSKEVADEG